MFAVMAMPETSIDEDDTLFPTEHKIRCSRQGSVVEAVSVSEPMKSLAKNHFRLCIRRFDPRHV